jgi:hypothetical protein
MSERSERIGIAARLKSHDVAERQRGGGMSERSERIGIAARLSLMTSPSASEAAA